MTVKQLIVKIIKLTESKIVCFHAGINHNMVDKSHGIYIEREKERETLLSD